MTIVQTINDTRAEAIRAMASGDHDAMAATEAKLAVALNGFIAYTEDNPEIAATENMRTLQSQLEETEDQIAASRRLFNGNVQAYNVKVQSVPTNLIAKVHGFQNEDFFELPDAEVAVVSTPPKIDLD